MTTGQQVIDKIEKMLVWYNDNCDKANIEDLLRLSDKLSILSVNVASMTAQADGHFLRAYFNRKCHFANRKLHWIDTGNSATVSQEIVLQEQEYKALKEEELDAEILTRRLELMLKQTNKVLDSLRQRISFEKMEMQRMNYLGSEENQR